MSVLGQDVAVVVLTAIDVEYQAVRRILSQVRRHDHPAGTVFEIGLLPGGGRVALGLTGAGNAGAAIIAERAIAIFQPAAALFVGVAGALADDLELGDVIVATKVYALHSGREEPDGFHPRPRSWDASHHLDQIARHVTRAGAWKKLRPNASGDVEPRVLFRPIAAGEVVLDSRTASLRDRLRRTYNDAAAIEMESSGVAQAGHLNDRLPILVVRGISDLADGAKSVVDRMGWQAIAAGNAAALGLTIAADLCDQPRALDGHVRSTASPTDDSRSKSSSSRRPSKVAIGSVILWGLLASASTAATPGGFSPASGNPGEPSVNPTAHTQAVKTVAFNPSGTILASGGDDRTIRFWDPLSGEPIGSPMTGHTEGVECVAFSPDGSILASAAGDRTIRLWDVGNRGLLRQPLIGHEARVRTVAFSPDGTILASGGEDYTVRLWDVATGQPVSDPFVGHAAAVKSVAFSPDGTILASGSDDNTIRLWNPSNGKLLGILTGHEGYVESVAFSPDGTILASAADDGTVRLWNPATAKQIGKAFRGHTSWVRGISYSPNGKLIASASGDRTVRLWNPATATQIGEPLTGHTDRVRSVAFSPDGKILASGAMDNTVKLWNLPDLPR